MIFDPPEGVEEIVMVSLCLTIAGILLFLAALWLRCPTC